MKGLLPRLVLVVAVVGLAGCKDANQVSYKLPDYVEQQGQVLVIEQDQVRMEILPQVAGRIGSLRYGKQELVLPHSADRLKYSGTVLWSSPQSEWIWPPIDVLDNLPYQVDTHNNQLVLTSAVDSKTGYQFSKTYVPAGRNAIAVTYRIYNRSAAPKPVAALEVTRVPAQGDVLFPVGDIPPTSGIFYPLPVEIDDGLCWFRYQAKRIRDDHHKIMLDGREGWIAYRNRNHLLIKEFEDLPPSVVAEGEREVEIFAHVDHTFLELKQQSAVEHLAPGEFLTWTVVWHARKLPQELLGDIKPAPLADYVRLELMRPGRGR